ncbi:MAG: cellulase family glycosylhydrolase [Alistipes sp.]|nr:cellulase family glycosylhydrolase [Alistipes sp.]
MNRKLMLSLLALSGAVLLHAQELVYQDPQGIIRYTANDREVAVFGANYCLPSASDYRAAHRVAPTTEAKKAMIDVDMEHFARMGFRALRLSFWGDWENSDKAGNLLDNDHLDLLDYLIAKASERGILMLLSPTVAHAAWWPDGDRDLPGFSAHYPKHELTFDPEAILAQQNYMTQLLNYRNRYTGRLYKEEPHIIAVEILNEPARILGRNEEIRRYIDTMSDAIRATGCSKIIAYNISENFYMAPALVASKAEAATYGWYPTQLNHGYTLQGNYLPYVDDYTPMKRIDVGPRSKFVYEFDAPDLVCSYMYPAQVREFREGGVQWAAMFSYDMIGTAPWNLGWQTHLLNFVYTPRKAISAMIAVKAMEALPRGKDWGSYPENSHFGPVTVDSKADRSTYYDGETLLYSNSAPETMPIDRKSLRHIAGVGSSSVARYDGTGIYLLDREEPGVWTLELYPDITQIDDPFKLPDHRRRVFTLHNTPHTLQLALPGLKRSFEGLTAGRYRLTRSGAERIGDVRYTHEQERVRLFQPASDYPQLLFTRGGFFSPNYDNRPSEAGNLRLYAEELTAKPEYWFPADISAQHHIGATLRMREAKPTAIELRVRALTPTTHCMRLLLSESEGEAWGTKIALNEQWQTIRIDLNDLQADCAPQLPQDWPGISPYYRKSPAPRSSGIDLGAVEQLYFSLRGEDFDDLGAASKGIEIESATLLYE